MSQSPRFVNWNEVPYEEWQEGDKFGSSEQDLGRAAGSERIGLRRETVSPGKQSAPQHTHMAEEELFIVLRGRGSILHGEDRISVSEGDVLSYPSGTGVAHAFVADAGEELEFLSIGERNPNDMVIYPTPARSSSSRSRTAAVDRESLAGSRRLVTGTANCSSAVRRTWWLGKTFLKRSGPVIVSWTAIAAIRALGSRLRPSAVLHDIAPQR